MSKLHTLFDRFTQLDFISVESVLPFIGPGENITVAENRTGNKLLYPQTIPETPKDLAYDLAVLRQALKMEPGNLYSRTLKKLVIPEDFLQHFPNLGTVIPVLIDSLELDEVTFVYLQSSTIGTKNLGSILRPKLEIETPSLEISVDTRVKRIPLGTITYLPTFGTKADLGFKFIGASLNSKSEMKLEALGGILGVVVDTR